MIHQISIFFPKQLVVASARSKFPVHRCKTGGAVAKTEFHELCQFGKLQNVAKDGKIGSLWHGRPATRPGPGVAIRTTVSRSNPRFWTGVGVHTPCNFYNAPILLKMGTRSHLPWICIPFVAEIDIRIISIISMAISESTPIFETSNC